MPVLVTHRGSVNAWECDENDHLNVRFYAAKANEGLAFVLSQLGHSPAALDALGARPRVLSQHMRFLREARKATPLTVVSGVAARTSRSVTIYGEVRHSLTNAVHATVLTDVALVSRDGSLQDLGALPSSLHCEVPAHGAPRGISSARPFLPPARAALGEAGFVEISRGGVRAAECDEHGEMEPFQYIGRISDGVLNLFLRFQSEEEIARRAQGVEGGALLELRLTHRAPLRSGSLFTIHSGFRSAGTKTLQVVHLVFDEVAQECVAVAEGVTVSMDLEARKAIEIPEARRRRIEAGLIKV